VPATRHGRNPSGPPAAVRQIERADAIVVLGCPRSPRLDRRLRRGIELWRAGAAPVLVLSGGGSGPEPEAVAMRRAAIGGGVPEAAVLVEPHSRDTLGNARETAHLLQSGGWRRVVLVSDRTHLPRAAMLFRLAGVRVVARSGVSSGSPALELATALREAVAFPPSLVRALVTGPKNRRRPPACDR
jgi:uncharacterized SAM-binding protein YcdF (DUF218 family)